MPTWTFASGSGLPRGSRTTTRIVRARVGAGGEAGFRGSPAAAWRGWQSAQAAARSTAARVAPASQPRPSRGGRRPPASSRRTRPPGASGGDRRQGQGRRRRRRQADERLGVVERRAAAGHRPVVARLLGAVAQPAAGQQRERVPGKHADEDLRQQRRPVVAAAEMGQLVAEDGRAVARERRPLRDQDGGRAAPAPDRGRDHRGGPEPGMRRDHAHPRRRVVQGPDQRGVGRRPAAPEGPPAGDDVRDQPQGERRGEGEPAAEDRGPPGRRGRGARPRGRDRSHGRGGVPGGSASGTASGDSTVWSRRCEGDTIVATIRPGAAVGLRRARRPSRRRCTTTTRSGVTSAPAAASARTLCAAPAGAAAARPPRAPLPARRSPMPPGPPGTHRIIYASSCPLRLAAIIRRNSSSPARIGPGVEQLAEQPQRVAAERPLHQPQAHAETLCRRVVVGTYT